MKKLTVILIFLSAVMAGCVCGPGCDDCGDKKKPNKCIDPKLVNKNAGCYEIYSPVCGCDNVTYSNDCYAKNTGVTSWKAGECN